ncbi:nitrilase-related carbon-nitrogen hydrolase [Thalassotalea mangrovi]|uniref:Hydrolase n=1 Tax=Thalassotalea mangrovi TaxID=2572245 RepID=A0A4U1B7V9_9GAMM|nr:nitrilase-related carbon-nitrogen hydrolase [Thalassotalea mangrovi]TKB46072.1 hydrolase [Thalassotalea mangrovi]
MIRVAAAQFAVTNNVEENLQTCLRMIKQAAGCSPDLIVLPEFVNHNSWYDDKDHCYRVSVELDGHFLGQIAEAAQLANAYLVVNCTVRRADNKVTGTSLMYAPSGELLGENNKQVLVGHENDFLEPANKQGPIVDTPIGRLAMYSCMDGVINETPRCLSLRGAQVLCNSLNSFAIDEGDLHIPVRAAENKVFVVAANKVGPLIPEEVLQPISEAINIPVNFLSGAGDSQIVAPDGTILAMAGKEEDVIWADIDVEQANHKLRPDHSDIFSNRRPELYQRLGEDPAMQSIEDFEAPEDVTCAAISVTSLDEAVELINASSTASLICLPECFFLQQPKGTDEEVELSRAAVQAISAACSPGQLIATSIVTHNDNKLCHTGVIIASNGIVFEQGQVHFSSRFHWSALSDEFNVYQSRFGTLAITLEDDAIYPETYRLIAMQGAQTVLAPLATQEGWQTTTGLRERASENRVNVIAADKNSANNQICVLQKEFTIMTPWQERQFDGLLSACECVRGGSENAITQGVVHPKAAANKVCSHRTHLINNRPWRLLQPML